MSSKFITVSSQADSWGDYTGDFDAANEASKIASAAESAGIEVYRDGDRVVRHDDDGNERTEIDWFGRWCIEGYEWTEQQWAEWFENKGNK